MTNIQAAFHLGRIIIQQTRIQSGVYKKRVVRKGGTTGPMMNEQELLDDEIQTMEAHSKHLADAAYG